MNKFSFLTAEEKKMYFGRTQHDKKKLLKQQEAGLALKSVSSLPETVDWRTKG